MHSDLKFVVLFAFVSILAIPIISISATNTSEMNSTQAVGRLIAVVSDDMHGWTQSTSYQYAIGTNTEKNRDGAIYYGLKFNNELYSSYSQNIGGKIVKIVGVFDDIHHTVIVESMLWPTLNSIQKQTPSITTDHMSNQKNICPLDSIEYYGQFSGPSENIHKSFVAHIHSYLKYCESEGYAMPSPLSLLKAQVPVNEIICNDDLTLLLKPSTDSPVCVKESTMKKLILRGWNMTFPIVFETDKHEYKLGEPITITMKNVGINTLKTSSTPIGFSIYDENDNRVCTWNGVNLQVGTFASGETLTEILDDEIGCRDLVKGGLYKIGSGSYKIKADHFYEFGLWQNYHGPVYEIHISSSLGDS